MANQGLGFHENLYPVSNESSDREWVALATHLGKIAGEHISLRGHSVDQLKKDGKSWFLSKLILELHGKMPSSGSYKIKTWAPKFEKYYAHREFWVSSEESDCVAKAYSLWSVADLEKRSAVPLPESIQKIEPHSLGEPLFPEGFARLRRLESSHSKQVDQVEVTRADLDLNDHVTFSSYLRWIAATPEVEGKELNRLEVQFRAEARLGDRVQVITSSGLDSFEHEILRPNASGQSDLLLRGRTSWK